MSIRINPSVLAADFVNFQSEFERIASADLAHIDVMDNHFVPNLTFGPPMVERMQECSPIPLDIHLMIEDPDRWAPQYAELGAYSVTFHAEATRDPVAVAKSLRDRGSRAGVALKPGTPIEPYLEILPSFDMILIMTVEPGFGGQKFMSDMMPKLRMLRSAITAKNLDLWLEVDGGVSLDTIVECAEAGADTFVAGSAIFRGDPAEQIALLRDEAQRHTH